MRKIFTPYAAHFQDFRPWVLHRGYILGEDKRLVDEVLAVFMPGPKTYTGEDMAEIQCHGNPLILQTILRRLLLLGARAAREGEFTKRAFLSHRMDLSQAEAVAELVSSPSLKAVEGNVLRLSGGIRKKIESAREKIDQLRAEVVLSVDFPDDEVENISYETLFSETESLYESLAVLLTDEKRARLLQEGARIVLAGRVNAGKSSLMNALLGRERALVTPVAGTTRDFLEEMCDLDGLALHLIDTAGLRSGEERENLDQVEALGIERTFECIRNADGVLMVLDGERWSSADLEKEICPDPCYRELMERIGKKKGIGVWNKCDIREPRPFPPRWGRAIPWVSVSAKNETGFSALFHELSLLFGTMTQCEHVQCNARQSAALEKALSEISLLKDDISRHETCDCLAVRLEQIAYLLDDVTGVSTSAEILDAIFGRFCIGK